MKRNKLSLHMESFVLRHDPKTDMKHRVILLRMTRDWAMVKNERDPIPYVCSVDELTPIEQPHNFGILHELYDDIMNNKGE